MKTAFIVDDDPDSAERLWAILEMAGFKAVHYTTFADALADIQDGPCVVLVEYQIRKSSITFEHFVAELRSHSSGIRIVCITADARMKAKCAELKIDDILLKPYEPEHVIQIVAQHCPRMV